MAPYLSFLYVSLLTNDKSDTTTFNCSIIQLFNHSLIEYGTHAVYHGVWEQIVISKADDMRTIHIGTPERR